MVMLISHCGCMHVQDTSIQNRHEQVFYLNVLCKSNIPILVISEKRRRYMSNSIFEISEKKTQVDHLQFFFSFTRCVKKYISSVFMFNFRKVPFLKKRWSTIIYTLQRIQANNQT